MLGEYFFSIYKDDKKEGLKQIKNFLSNQFLLDDKQMIESIDFLNNDFKFLDKGIKDNMTYMRKKYKW